MSGREDEVAPTTASAGGSRAGAASAGAASAGASVAGVSTAGGASAVLRVAGLRIVADRGGAGSALVDGLSFTIAPGEVLGIVGESGSGKSMTAYAIAGLLPPGVHQAGGAIEFEGRGLGEMRPDERRALAGRRIGMVFQDPLSSFNPVRTVGSLLVESAVRHQGAGAREAREKAIAALAEVNLPRPELLVDAYPHQLSGGQRQRAMIALATLNSPALLIADEPTTALDATVQLRILALLKDAARDRATILITHDLAVAAALCQRILVMQRGRCVEQGSTQQILTAPTHPYTRELLAAVEPVAARTASSELLEVRDVSVTFATRDRVVKAVQRCSITVRAGEMTALVGESGSGKSTLARVVAGIVRPTAGNVKFSSRDLAAVPRSECRAVRRRIQMVFQDPDASLNPMHRVRTILSEPLVILGGRSAAQIEARILELLQLVRLDAQFLDKRPRELSGGQKQRVAIARALAMEPELLIADEPLSALDVSTAASIAELLCDLQQRLSLGILFISHDLQVVRRLAARVSVMRAGEIVEEGACASVLDSPQHAYTRELVASTPDPKTGKLNLARVAELDARAGDRGAHT